MTSRKKTTARRSKAPAAAKRATVKSSSRSGKAASRQGRQTSSQGRTSSRNVRRGLQLEIVNRSGKSVPTAFVKKWVALLAREAALAINPAQYVGRDFVIAFVSTSEIRALNKAYRGKDKPTDVLSFGSDGDPSSLGELAIAPAVISAQARDHGLRVREELGYMILHGFLHLLGYDHETNERDARRMFKLQDELFERLLAKI